MKNPRVDDIVGLGADVVIAKDEENGDVDIVALRAAGQPVWATAPRTLPAAFVSLDRMLRLACGLPRPQWLDDATAAWQDRYAGPGRRAAVLIWRRPWMAVGPDTFAGDLLDQLGIDNVLATYSTERYPRVDLAELRDRRPDLIVLPDEPYAFSRSDGPEAFAGWGVPVTCVSGRHLTWYGSSLVDARTTLTRQLAEPV